VLSGIGAIGGRPRMPKRADNSPAIGRRNFLKSATLVGALRH
jgi:hypothetical protein